jgi:hypothetical protein
MSRKEVTPVPRLALVGLLAIVVLLVGASAVFAQDANQGAPGNAVAPICPNAGAGIEQMKQMHDSMGQNVPENMRQMHDAMGQAMQNGDIEQMQQMQSVCRGMMGGQPQST